MLKVFRDNLKYLSWILWLVVALFIFFIWADFGGGLGRRGGRGGQGGLDANVAAHVGNETVSLAEFEHSYRRLEDLYRQIYRDQLTPDMARQMGLPLQALNQAVSQKILLIEARRMGLAVTDGELRDRILQESAFKDEQGQFIGTERYREIVSNLRYPSTTAFEAELREEILVRKLLDILEANLYVTDQEVEQSYRDQVEKARIRYVQLPRAGFVQAATGITGADVNGYFVQHRQEFRLPEQREVAWLLVDPSMLAAAVDESAQRNYYQEHLAEFSTPEQVHARHILIKTDRHSDAEALQLIEAAQVRLKKGESFAAVARDVSEDTVSKATGGDVSYFQRGKMVKPFSDAAFDAQVGSVVGPVKTEFGYHLIEVLDHQKGGAQPFEAVRESIRQRLTAERTAEMSETRAKDLAKKLAAEKPKSVDALKTKADAAQGIAFGEGGPFSRQEPVPNLGFAPEAAAAAFALQKGGVSEALQTPRGWAVFYLKEIHPPRLPELKDVEPRVRAALVRQKQQDAALDQLRQARAAGKTLDQIATELGLTVKETAEFGTKGAIPGIGLNPELAKAAMALDQGKIGEPVGDAQGALLFEVTERKSWDPIQFAASREQTRESLRREKLNALEASLLEQRRREIDVRFNPQVLEQFGIGESGQPVQPGQPGQPG